MTGRQLKRGTNWSRAKHRMPASFTDLPVQGRRNDDGLDLVEAVTASTALAATAELATGDGPVREEAVSLHEDVVADSDESALDVVDENPDEEDD